MLASQSAPLAALVEYLDQTLAVKNYDDLASNGLQVQCGASAVARVALAVDSGLSVIEKATAAAAQLLIVHHGLFWGDCHALTGPLAKKVAQLMQAGCSLYAAHLPLDGHVELGNAVELARFLGLAEITPYFDYRGMPIGARARSAKSITIESLAAKCAAISGAIAPLILPFGKREIETIGIVTGSGSFAIPIAAAAGIDLLLSGEPKQESYHLARDLGLNVLFAGHYATETFGVRAVGRALEKQFNVGTIFIDEPTGI